MHPHEAFNFCPPQTHVANIATPAHVFKRFTFLQVLASNLASVFQKSKFNVARSTPYIPYAILPMKILN